MNNVEKYDIISVAPDSLVNGELVDVVRQRKRKISYIKNKTMMT